MDKYVFAIFPIGNIWWMAAAVKVTGIVAVTWVLVFLQKIYHKNLRKAKECEIFKEFANKIILRSIL